MDAEVNDRVIWHTKGFPFWIGRIIEILPEDEYVVEFDNGETKTLHKSEIGLY